MPRTRPASALPNCDRFNQVCGLDTMEVRNPLDRENPIRIPHIICHGTRYHQAARRQVMTATETFSILRQSWLKHCDAMEVLIMDQGTEFAPDFQHLCQSRVPAADGRRIEVPAQDLSLFGGVQLAADITLRSVLTCNGEPHPHAANVDGAVLVAARREKEATFPEIAASGRCKLVVVGIETGGRWNEEGVVLTRILFGNAGGPECSRRSALRHWWIQWSAPR